MNSPRPAWMVAWATIRLASSPRRAISGTTRRANRPMPVGRGSPGWAKDRLQVGVGASPPSTVAIARLNRGEGEVRREQALTAGVVAQVPPGAVECAGSGPGRRPGGRHVQREHHLPGRALVQRLGLGPCDRLRQHLPISAAGRRQSIRSVSAAVRSRRTAPRRNPNVPGRSGASSPAGSGTLRRDHGADQQERGCLGQPGASSVLRARPMFSPGGKGMVRSAVLPEPWGTSRRERGE